MTAARTVDAAEVEKFSRMSADWWDPTGPFRPLHRLNPVRLSYIRDQAAAHFGRDICGGAPTGIRGLKPFCRFDRSDRTMPGARTRRAATIIKRCG